MKSTNQAPLVANGKLFKVVVVGNSNTGKTYIIERFVKGELPKNS